MARSRYPVTRRGGNMPATWDPFGDWMSRFMAPSLAERFLSTGEVAPVDVCERDNEFVVRMACAGCRPDDVEVTVENDTVRIRGKFMDHEMMMGQQGTGSGQQAGGQQMSGQQATGQQTGGQQTGSQQGTGQQMAGRQTGQATGAREVCLIRELPAGRFERDIVLPTAVNADQAKASFENGMLTLVLPKMQAAMGHRIQIGSGTGAGTR